MSFSSVAVLVGSCSCKPIGTGQATSAIRLHSQPLLPVVSGEKAAGQTDRQTDAATDLDVSHTNCASLVTDAQNGNGLIKKL